MVSDEIERRSVRVYDRDAMKKLISFIFAVVSTTFLFAGATQAAEKFDVLGRSVKPSSGSVMDGPAMPCTEQEN
jgi:hypothetical protein